jgi:hypothetical protein
MRRAFRAAFKAGANGRTASNTTGSEKWPSSITRWPIGKSPATLRWPQSSVLAMGEHYFLSGGEATTYHLVVRPLLKRRCSMIS